MARKESLKFAPEFWRTQKGGKSCFFAKTSEYSIKFRSERVNFKRENRRSLEGAKRPEKTRKAKQGAIIDAKNEENIAKFMRFARKVSGIKVFNDEFIFAN